MAAAATSKGQKYQVSLIKIHDLIILLIFQLKTIEHLLAAGSKSEKVVLLGMLSQLHEVISRTDGEIGFNYL